MDNLTLTPRELKVLKHAKDHGYLQKKFDKEADLLTHCKTMLGMLGALIVREDHVSENGVADLIICYKGTFIAAELKSINGTPTMSQLLFLQKVRKAGGYAAVCDTVLTLFGLLTSVPHISDKKQEAQK